MINFLVSEANVENHHPVKYKIFDFILSPLAKDLTGSRKIYSLRFVIFLDYSTKA